MYGRVHHCWDSDSYEVARLRDRVRELEARLAEVEYTQVYDSRAQEGGATMSGVIVETLAGYRYPDDWNAKCRKFGFEEGLEDDPSRGERVARALRWGTTALRERLAFAIAPDDK